MKADKPESTFSKVMGAVKSALSYLIRNLFTKESITNFLKDKVVKLALKKVFGTLVAATGPGAWIVKLIATELFEEVAIPLINSIYRFAGYQKFVEEGIVTFRKIKNAENRDDWRDAARDA